MTAARRLLAALALAAALAGAPAGPAAAQDVEGGEAAYAGLMDGAAALSAIEPTSGERRDFMRATAVKLADRLKRFIIAETEARADDKVGAPPGASRPAGAPAPAEDGPPEAGARTDIAEVPNPWFARQATRARRALDTLIKSLDSGDREAAELMLQAERVRDALHALARPPDAGPG